MVVVGYIDACSTVAVVFIIVFAIVAAVIVLLRILDTLYYYLNFTKKSQDNPTPGLSICYFFSLF